jgi:hypothetical protein
LFTAVRSPLENSNKALCGAATKFMASQKKNRISFPFSFFWSFLRPFLAAFAKRFKNSILTTTKIMQQQQQTGLSHRRAIWSISSCTPNIPRQAVNGPVMEKENEDMCQSDRISFRHRVHIGTKALTTCCSVPT